MNNANSKVALRLKIFSLTCLNIFVQVVDVDPSSGDVTAVAVVLIQAAILTKSRNQQYTMSSLHRMQYQASFKFCWNIDSGHYYIIDSDPLKEISGYKVNFELLIFSGSGFRKLNLKVYLKYPQDLDLELHVLGGRM